MRFWRIKSVSLATPYVFGRPPATASLRYAISMAHGTCCQWLAAHDTCWEWLAASAEHLAVEIAVEDGFNAVPLDQVHKSKKATVVVRVDLIWFVLHVVVKGRLTANKCKVSSSERSGML